MGCLTPQILDLGSAISAGVWGGGWGVFGRIVFEFVIAACLCWPLSPAAAPCSQVGSGEGDGLVVLPRCGN